MSARVAVATDSSACLPAPLTRQWGVEVIPLQVVVGDRAYDEDSGIPPRAVVDALVDGQRVSTSQPGPETIRRAVAHAVDKGAEALVVVTLSGAMSGTAAAVEAAASSAPIRVMVVDSGTVALAVGLAALSAAALARSGADADAVAAEARRAARASLCLFTVDTLEYLRRGGRVSPAVAAVGNALGVRPVLGVMKGEVGQVERVRTSGRARQAVLDRIADRAPAQRHPVVGLMSVSGDDAVVDDAVRVLGTRGDWPVVRAELSAVLAAHGGPGALAAVVVDCHPEVAAALARR